MTTPINLATDVVAAYVAHNQVPMDRLVSFFAEVHAAITEAQSGAVANGAAIAAREPAVPVKKSVADGYLICLEDGKKLTMLKRYLRTHFNMSPEAYRRKWGLPHDYPMVAPAYARLRSAFAKKNRLGHVPTRRGRK